MLQHLTHPKFQNATALSPFNANTMTNDVSYLSSAWWRESCKTDGNITLTRSNCESCRVALLDCRDLQKFSSLLALTRAKMIKSVWWGCCRDARHISYEEGGVQIINWTWLQQTFYIMRFTLTIMNKRAALPHWGHRGILYPPPRQLPSWFPCGRPADTWEAETCRTGSVSPLSV